MRFGTWNVRSFCRADTTKLEKYKLDIMVIKEVRWNNSGSRPPDDYTFFYGNVNANHHLQTGFLVQKVIRSAVKWLKLVDDRVSYITLRCQCDTVLNVHAPI